MVMLNSGAIISRSAAGDQSSPFAAQMNKPVRLQNLHRVLAQVLTGGSELPRIAKTFDIDFAGRVPLRILVADDNAVNRKVVARLLERWGYHPDVVQNGLEVLDALGRCNYDLVLLDVQMPEMDGIEAAERICAERPAGQRPQLIALTAGVFKEDRERCLQAGMDGFLGKPVVVADLQTVLENCFQQVRGSDRTCYGPGSFLPAICCPLDALCGGPGLDGVGCGGHGE